MSLRSMVCVQSRRQGSRRFGAQRLAIALCGLVALCVPSVCAAAVVPPSGTVYNDLAVQWWQYALSRPAATSPLRDATGARCADGQSGPVFFLAGGQGSTTVERTCTVHGSKSLFLPIINTIDFHTPAGDFPDQNTTPALVYQEFLGNTRGGSGDLSATGLHASVDGTAITDLKAPTTPYRVCALPVSGCSPDAFSFSMPANNVFDFAHEPAGTYFPALQDGYYLLLEPLAPGLHTVAFGGRAFFGGRFSQDITYHLTVVP